MDRLPADLCVKIFCLLDHQTLATAESVCTKWKGLALNDMLWCNLFKERWGVDRAFFYAPVDSKSWKDIYIVQDRCDRLGLGLKIIREGDDYYLVHQGEIQRHLGSRHTETCNPELLGTPETSTDEDEGRSSILDKILFFIGDLESASVQAKRSKLL